MKLKILVVDDQDIVRDIVPAQLAHFGHEGKAVESLQETISTIQDWQPHAVILDLMMPVHDGIEILESVLAKFESPPYFIAMTGANTNEKRRIAHEAGFEFFLRKPFKLADLSIILEQLCEAIQRDQNLPKD